MTSELSKVKVTGGFHVVLVVIINFFLLSANTASVLFSTESLEVPSNGPELKRDMISIYLSSLIEVTA